MELESIKNAILIEERAKEFQGNKNIRDLIFQLRDKIPVIRGVRGDGNCFYRAFGFAYLEYILTNKLTNRIKHLKNMIINDSETWNVCTNYLTKDLINKELMLQVFDFQDADTLQKRFNDSLQIDAMVVFIFRHYAKLGYLKFANNPDEKEKFEMYKDQLKDIRAYGIEAMEGSTLFLVNALHINLTIYYQDRNINVELPYTPTLNNTDNFEELQICLYFRPGHYDIGYDTQFSQKMYKNFLKNSTKERSKYLVTTNFEQNRIISQRKEEESLANRNMNKNENDKKCSIEQSKFVYLTDSNLKINNDGHNKISQIENNNFNENKTNEEKKREIQIIREDKSIKKNYYLKEDEINSEKKLHLSNIKVDKEKEIKFNESQVKEEEQIMQKKSTNYINFIDNTMKNTNKRSLEGKKLIY